jgi:hypothetical protein
MEQETKLPSDCRRLRKSRYNPKIHSTIYNDKDISVHVINNADDCIIETAKTNHDMIFEGEDEGLKLNNEQTLEQTKAILNYNDILSNDELNTNDDNFNDEYNNLAEGELNAERRLRLRKDRYLSSINNPNNRIYVSQSIITEISDEKQLRPSISNELNDNVPISLLSKRHSHLYLASSLK